MKNCPNCQTELIDSAKYCKNCGERQFDMDPDRDLLTQELKDKGYIVEKRVGQGGMGSVYLAEQTKLDRKVVIKILNATLSEEREMRDRFLREARTGAKLKHANIVDIIDVGVAEGRPYFIMEYGEGGSLEERIKKTAGGIPLKEAIGIVVKVLRGLHFAHGDGVVHRDIKPENILFRRNGDPFLVDFGIAKVASGTVKTQTGLTMGTVSYMSPEQCQGDPGLDGRSDIYSSGIMLYQLVVGELPFRGETPLSVLNMHIREKFPSITGKLKSGGKAVEVGALNIGELDGILRRMCEKEKEKRYANAEEAATALEGLVGGKPAAGKERSQKERESEYVEILKIVYEDGQVSAEERALLNGKIIELGLTLEKARSLEKKFQENKDRPAGGSFLSGRGKYLLMGGILLLMGIVGSFFLLGEKDNIRITSEPEGAEVLNSLSGEVLGTTPYSAFKDEIGSYEYRIRKEGYRDVELDVKVRDVKTVSKEHVKLEVFGNIRIESEPMGASLSGNSEVEGKTTPYTGEWKPGRYTIDVSKEGYVEESLSVTITKDGGVQTKKVSLVTEAEQARIDADAELKAKQEAENRARKEKEERERQAKEKEERERKQKEELAKRKRDCESGGGVWNGSSCREKEVSSGGGAKGPQEAIGLSWSAYQGEMDWYKAKSRCSSLGMRLPTKDELVRLYNSGAGWKNQGCSGRCVYWSSTEYSAEYAYDVNMTDGYVYDNGFKDNGTGGDVRCVR